jgi:hypothetical protein
MLKVEVVSFRCLYLYKKGHSCDKIIYWMICKILEEHRSVSLVSVNSLRHTT